jgi:hypothetical protein
MRPFLRFLVYILDSIPCFSWRRCAAEWELGREYGQKQIGIARDERGRFRRVSPMTIWKFALPITALPIIGARLRPLNMDDDQIISEVRAELFDRNTREIAQGREWGVVIPALIRRIDELEAALDNAYRDPQSR